MLTAVGNDLGGQTPKAVPILGTVWDGTLTKGSCKPAPTDVPLADKTVTITQDGASEPIYTLTDMYGKFCKEVLPGVYWVEVDIADDGLVMCPGMSNRRKVTVQQGTPKVVDFPLER